MMDKTVTMKLRDLIMGGAILALIVFFALQLISIRASLESAKVVLTTQQNAQNIGLLDQALSQIDKRVQELEKK